MAVVSISLYSTPRRREVKAHITCHGVREGHYGDLWHVETTLEPDAEGSLAALHALADYLRSLR